MPKVVLNLHTHTMGCMCSPSHTHTYTYTNMHTQRFKGKKIRNLYRVMVKSSLLDRELYLKQQD